MAPDAFEKLIAGSDAHSEYGVLSPLQMKADGKSFERLFEHLIIEKMPDNFLHQELCEVGFVQAAHWMLTRRCIETVGGFSPSFPHYGEDDNYCQRALYHNLKIGIVPAAKAVHDAANKPLVISSQKRYRHFITFLIFLSDPCDSQSLVSLLWFLLRKAKGLAVERKSLTSFGGFFKAIYHLPMIRRNRLLSMTEKCAFLKYE